LAPGVRRRTIDLGPNPPTRAFLLKAAAGISLLPHGHSALEWTLVLSGAFAEGGELHQKGDFVAADQDDQHQIKIEPGEACVCLIAMQGEMKWRGPLAPLANLLFRL
jgi:putative transcriptional regulator